MEISHNPEIFAKISNFNLWSYSMTKDEIIHMSYGCSKDEGDILSWVAVRKKMKEKFQEEKSSICNEHNGELGSNFQLGVHLTVCRTK